MLKKHSTDLSVGETIGATLLISAASVVGAVGGLLGITGLINLGSKIRSKKSKKA